MRWCDKPHEWQEMLDLSVKPKLTDEDEERLIDLQAIFGTGGEKKSDRFAGIYNVLKGNEVVLQSTADIASDYIGVTREQFHWLPTISSLERMADQIGISVADLVRGGGKWE